MFTIRIGIRFYKDIGGMKIIILITIALCMIPLSSFALDQMKDSELDQVTGKFGTSAISDASALSAPAGEVGAIAGNLSPLAEPASIGVNAISEGSYYNDRANDVTSFTTYFVITGDVVRAPGLGFF